MSVSSSSSPRGSALPWRAGLALLLLLLPFAPAAFAAEEAAADDDSGETVETFLDEVTVTATRTERAVGDTPGVVDVITSDEIEERGYVDREDLVRYLPGVYVDGDPTRLGLNGFNIRGIGGNRVLTEVDGIPTAEQFDFGPFSVFQFSVDVENIESVEVVRSAGSALYGSDALGGVVSLTTRRPNSYLNGEPSFFSVRGGYDDRSAQSSLSGIAAFGGDRVQGSIQYTRRDGSETENQGTNESLNSTRTAPNPIDRVSDNALIQLSLTPNDQTEWLGAVEYFDGEAETEVLSSRRVSFGTATIDVDGVDTQERLRVSLALNRTFDSAFAENISGRTWFQQTETDQVVTEIRVPRQGQSLREGLVAFDQDTVGLEVELRKSIGNVGLLTYGIAFQEDSFDQLRNRTEFVQATGEPVPTFLAFPTKYFPESDVQEFGAFVQAEIELFDGRLSLVPGVRFDSYDLDANENDTIFLEGNPGSPPPVGLTEESVSPKLGLLLSLTDEFSLFAQYAAGFRAPPMSSVNNGFTNLGGGYRTLASPDLDAETSDNLEVGLRGNFRKGSFSVAVYENTYDDFIEIVGLGFNPIVGLLEFQPRNVTDVEISGVEFSGEARLSRNWLARAAYTYTEGENRESGQPLESIAPPQLVLGVRYAADSGKWGAELIGTANDSKDASDLPDEFGPLFAVPSNEILDLSAWYAFSDRWYLQVSGWNLTDETYWS
ncbi:MAG: TonB-dependent receptor, partial [Acidobacteriota bacterium]